MNILVTGGSGFIGSNLAEVLVDKGHNVIILDTKKNPKNISNFIDKVKYVQGDVRDNELLDAMFCENEFGGIVHLAAVSRVIWGEENPNNCVDVNINGTRTLLESMKRNKQKPWFIFGSSREVYGEPTELPVCENCPETPVNIYGKTKVVGENLVREYSKKLGLSSAILRFSNVYGNERDILDRVIPRFILSALKGEELEIHGGNQLFDFTHIKDTVNGIVKTIELLENNRGNYSEDFHILTGKGTTLQELVKIISQHLDQELDVVYKKSRNYDVEQFVGNPSKATEMLNFKADVLPERGILATIERYKEAFDL